MRVWWPCDCWFSTKNQLSVINSGKVTCSRWLMFFWFQGERINTYRILIKNASWPCMMIINLSFWKITYTLWRKTFMSVKFTCNIKSWFTRSCIKNYNNKRKSKTLCFIRFKFMYQVVLLLKKKLLICLGFLQNTKFK